MKWYIDIFGYLGGGFACVRFIPQIYKCYVTKSTQDLSWGLLILSLSSQVFTITYAVLINSKPLIIPIGIAIVLTSLLSMMKIKYDNQEG